ncbi:MAG: DUF4421 domain-containing protein [Bacteroidales bacterium]|nr:DUF4421 domain-containing protein [Bacteroidales bacterium]
MARTARLITLIISLLLAFPAGAQGFLTKLSGENDTNYVESFLDQLTTRVYASIKTTEISMRDQNINKNLIYHPNDALILGFGFNYGILGLNIGFNLPFINNDDAKYGKTDYLDLQTHVYFRPFILDIYAQIYKGYHLTEPNDWITDWPSHDTFPARPDISSVSIGLNGHYIFNHKKFSYRAPFLQNEWQKKSAGSFLLGGNMFYVDTKGDSSFIPKEDTTFFEGTHFSQSRIANIGVNAGYAQTFVVKQHFFLTMSLVGGLSGGGSWIYTSEEGEIDRSGFTVAGNISGRVALGYNSKKFFAGVSYLWIFVRNQSPIPQTWLGYDTGMFRFNVVYRFRLKKDLRFLSRTEGGK